MTTLGLIALIVVSTVAVLVIVYLMGGLKG